MSKGEGKPYVIVVDSGALSPHFSAARIILDRDAKDEMMKFYVQVKPGKDYRHELQSEMHTVREKAREGSFPSAIVGCPFVTNALIVELKDEGILVPPVYIVPSLHENDYCEVPALRPLMEKAAEEGHIIDPNIRAFEPGSLAHRLVDLVNAQGPAASAAAEPSHSRSIAPEAKGRPGPREIPSHEPGSRGTGESSHRG